MEKDIQVTTIKHKNKLLHKPTFAHPCTQGHTSYWCWNQDLNSARDSLTPELYHYNYCARVIYFIAYKG